MNKEISMSSRSTFFNIEPMGVGTENVESLISYITRIAEAHCIKTSIIFKSYISTNNEKPTYKHNKTSLNGMSGRTWETVSKLEQLTTTTNLSELTLLKYKNVIAAQQLMKIKRSWCPYCLEEMKDTSVPIYEKLIWNIYYVHYCHLHEVKLEEVCPSCHSTQSLLDPNQRNGKCYSCGKWLGLKRGSPSNLNQDFKEKELLRLTKHIGELLAIKNLEGTNLLKSLLYLKEYSSPNKKESLLKEFGISLAEYQKYINLKRLPSLGRLIKISSHFNIPIVQMFNNNPLNPDFGNRDLKGLGEIIKKETKLKNKSDIEVELEKFLENSEGWPINWMQLSKKLGWNKETIKRNYPALYLKVSEKNKARRNDIKDIKRLEKNEKIHACIISIINEGNYPSILKIKERLPIFHDANKIDKLIREEILKKYNIPIRYF